MASTLNLATLKTPGVYIDEVSLFPPSVAQVETAIPAFIGYSEKAEKDGKSITGKALKIKSMVEYRDYFGGGPGRKITVNLTPTNAVKSVEMEPAWYLHDSLMMFFANGGEKCYIISMGNYDTKPVSQTHFKDALEELKKHDEPTLIVMPDAMLLADIPAIAAVQQAAIDQCNKLQDRFAILDVKVADLAKTAVVDTDISAFRGSVSNFLKYGAAYYPWLKTSLPFEVSFTSLTIKKNDIERSLDELLNPVAPSPTGTSIAQIQEDIKTFIPAFPAKAAYLDETTNAKKEESITKTLEKFTKIGLDKLKNEEVKTAFTAYIKADTDPLKSVLDRITALDEASTAENFAKAFEEVVKYMATFLSDAESRIAQAKQKLPVAETTQLLVQDALSLKKDILGAGLPDRTAYDNTAGNAEKKAFILDALTTFTGQSGDTAFTNTDVRLAFSKYVSILTANGQIPGAIQKSLDDTLLTSPETKFNAIFEDVVSYITSFWSDLQTRLKSKAQEIRSKVPLFNAVVSAAEAQGIILPPSGAVAGIYASVDENRGVWKAPANVGISNVVGPTVLINDADQEDLNVDVDAGKSINAIRFFTNKGTLVWGARTLAGNDNEWRYVSVRRFFIMVEESVKKASSQFVFEPNDANTWVKMRAMIENFLTLQWRAGALAGIKPEHAFYVRVGLGQTMTAQDILNGFLIIEIGMAVVRPAEFIVLRFSHKMQES